MMELPEVLGLPLEEAVPLLEARGWEWTAKYLLTPRQREEAVNIPGCRKYVVRQQRLSENKVALAVICKLPKGGANNGSEDR